MLITRYCSTKIKFFHTEACKPRCVTPLRPINRHNHSRMNVHYWNAQSIGNKTTTICDYLLDKDVDILVITETWLAEDDPVTIPRPGDDEHGGIAFISKSCLKLSISPTGVDTVTFEHASMTDNFLSHFI